MRNVANQSTWNGRGPIWYFERCRWWLPLVGTRAIFTRDTGYHTSGWWKNPDYERCFHLSLSFVDIETGEPAPRDTVLTSLFLDALFGKGKRLLWCEPPYSEQGKQMDVWHYRLFCDEGWQPIKPRGEVYSRELTEAGWKSWSDAQAELAVVNKAEKARE
ncbi:hypothetical protein KJ912_04650 [Patescibacteria group bacterium]|nr:hypothetical protein [Patescibacteria group bacterium]